MKKITLLLIAVFMLSVVSSCAQNAQTRLDNGKSLFDQKNYDGAIQELNEAIRLAPNMAEAYAYRSWAYSRKNNNTQALTDANKAIQLNPRLGIGFFVRGRLQSDNDRAIADYNEAIRLDPRLAVAYINRGNAYFNKNDYDRAIADYNEAIRLDPKEALSYFNRGNVYLKKYEKNNNINDNNYNLALSDYQTALRIDPNDFKSKDNIAFLEKIKNSLAAQNQAEPASSFRYDLNEAGDGIVILEYIGSNRRLVIPQTIEGYTVKQIGNWDRPIAPSSRIKLVSVVIPEGVRVISVSAFYGQRELTNVTLPSTLEEIGMEAFCACYNLRTIRIPDSVKKIGRSAFMSNINLTDANIPSGIKEIGVLAFNSCSRLSNLTIPASITYIRFEGGGFEDTSLTLAVRRRLTELGYRGEF
jgi:Flp pilus assembly protein TadD